MGTRTENLALIYQESITAIVRLRANRQPVANAEVFRGQMRQLLGAAEQEARNRGYAAEDARLASFAVVAFLDESVLNLQNPVFAGWPRKPLQEEMFGGHVAGEIFFQSLQRLLERNESAQLADVLEVFYLCLLLGYRGKYGAGGQADLKARMDAAAEKIRRIRKPSGLLSPDWAPPARLAAAAAPDTWFRPMLMGAAACVLLALLLLVGFRVSLGSGVSALRTAVAETRK
ncbi:MAG: DotU family type IV/VI secretion system protein [Bryobacterales bacterium]|nr:DotU family type IV/VI secretion system protein [Bryobacterales bacterium]